MRERMHITVAEIHTQRDHPVEICSLVQAEIITPAENLTMTGDHLEGQCRLKAIIISRVILVGIW